jgi:hypothetical protein
MRGRPKPKEMIRDAVPGFLIDEQTGSATPAEMAAIDAFNDRLEAEGHRVFAGGLASPKTATVVDNRNGEPATKRSSSQATLPRPPT